MTSSTVRYRVFSFGESLNRLSLSLKQYGYLLLEAQSLGEPFGTLVPLR